MLTKFKLKRPSSEPNQKNVTCLHDPCCYLDGIRYISGCWRGTSDKIANQETVDHDTNQEASYQGANEEAGHQGANEEANYQAANEEASYQATNQETCYQATNEKTSVHQVLMAETIHNPGWPSTGSQAWARKRKHASWTRRQGVEGTAQNV